ncbi:hypothetical protein B0H13DRAFT_1863740 [Mycena leptocephala]|nr:hypothetical protein B0H13DRAFT_1863740 [Mycena leptocephala]
MVLGAVLCFSFFATSALPITEVKYAVETPKAVGVALTSNHEGKYLGNPEFIPFFARMERKTAIIFVHPANPLFNQPQMKRIVEFLRTTASQPSLPTLNPRNIYMLPHVLSLVARIPVTLRRSWKRSTRVVGGITDAHQLGGLLAYNISPSFLLYGSDYPWIPASLADPAFDAIVTSL